MSSDRAGAVWLGVRSLFWTVILPGTMAGYVPWRYFGVGEVRFHPGNIRHLAGGLFILVGALFLLRCIWEFAASGRGTLSPVDPPFDLVVAGLYRYVRNPMYLSVATILLGEILLTRSTGLLSFAAIGALFVNVFVIGYEEPYLRRRFGASYARYTARVGRWIPGMPQPEDS